MAFCFDCISFGLLFTVPLFTSHINDCMERPGILHRGKYVVFFFFLFVRILFVCNFGVCFGFHQCKLHEHLNFAGYMCNC